MDRYTVSTRALSVKKKKKKKKKMMSMRWAEKGENFRMFAAYWIHRVLWIEFFVIVYMREG